MVMFYSGRGRQGELHPIADVGREDGKSQVSVRSICRNLVLPGLCEEDAIGGTFGAPLCELDCGGCPKAKELTSPRSLSDGA
jgi:hypothetical protein